MKIAPGTFDGQSCMAKDVRMRLEEQGHWAGDDTELTLTIHQAAGVKS